jgi:hypothetical protein
MLRGLIHGRIHSPPGGVDDHRRVTARIGGSVDRFGLEADLEQSGPRPRDRRQFLANVGIRKKGEIHIPAFRRRESDVPQSSAKPPFARAVRRAFVRS